MSENTQYKSIKEKVSEILDNKWIEPASKESFRVYSFDRNNHFAEYRVEWSLRKTHLLCNCRKFVRGFQKDQTFKCEHVLAVEISVYQREIHFDRLPEPSVDDAVSRFEIKWHCHPRTQKQIEKFISKLEERGITKDEISAFVLRKTGDRDAPQSLGQESAERLEDDLVDWLMDIEARRMAEMDMAA